MYPIQCFNLFNYVCYHSLHVMDTKKICIPGKNQKSIFSHFLALELFPTNQVFNMNIMKIKDS